MTDVLPGETAYVLAAPSKGTSSHKGASDLVTWNNQETEESTVLP